MPVSRHPGPRSPGPDHPGHDQPEVSHVFPGGGRHLWSSGAVSQVQSHDHGHLVYAASGVLAVHVDRGTSVVPADRIAWTPAGTTHQHRAHGQADMRILFLEPALARRIPDRPVVFAASALAREVVLALTGPASYERTERRYDGASRSRLLHVLVEELNDAQERPLHLPQPRDDRLQSIAGRLSDRPADNDTLAEHGRAVGASSRTLSRLIRTELAMTFYEWRTQLRIYRALVLLADGLDVTQTARACGWANPSDFIAAFSDLMGITPGRYRTARTPSSGGSPQDGPPTRE